MYLISRWRKYNIYSRIILFLYCFILFMYACVRTHSYCENYDATYVGQTKRKLNIRISEHRNQINRKSSNATVIMEHRLRHNDFDWLNVKIPDNERFFWKRIISEMFNMQL